MMTAWTLQWHNRSKTLYNLATQDIVFCVVRAAMCQIVLCTTILGNIMQFGYLLSAKLMLAIRWIIDYDCPLWSYFCFQKQMVQVIANGATSCDMFRLSRFVQLSLKEQDVINYWIALQKDREKNKSLNLFLNILLCFSWIIYSLVIHNWRLRLLFKHRHISVLLFELLNKNWISGATPRQLSMGGTFNIEWKEIGWIPRLRMFDIWFQSEYISRYLSESNTCESWSNYGDAIKWILLMWPYFRTSMGITN